MLSNKILQRWLIMADYTPFPRCKGGACGGDPALVLKTGGKKGNPADEVYQCTPPVPSNCPPATGGTCACYIVLIKYGPSGIIGGVDEEEQEEKIFPAQPLPPDPSDPTKDLYKGMLTKKTAAADFSPHGKPAGKRPTYWEYRCRCLDTSSGTPPLAMIERKREEEYVAVVVEERSERA
jgi:hypothetical protein